MRQMTTQIKEIGADATIVKALYRAGRAISLYFESSLHDAHRIPRDGGAMIVSNHALMGIDSWALIPELYHTVERIPRTLGLKSLFEVPGLSSLLKELGAVPGERECGVELLRRGELVLTYPGGAKDSLKGRADRYKLKWEGREGFAHVALSAAAPVVPVAAIGPDECFLVFSDDGVIPTTGFLNGKTDQMGYKLPLFVPLVRRVPFDFFVGEPIASPVEPGASDEEVREAAPEHAKAVRRAMESLIAEGLERRERRSRRSAARRIVNRVFGRG
jgi:1-acyl-sn-glycerol-3-phosphate acyltransferase